MHKKPSTVEVQEDIGYPEVWLEARGWRPDRRGWVHPLLHFPWPIHCAVQLQAEAEAKKPGLVYQILREEVW